MNKLPPESVGCFQVDAAGAVPVAIALVEVTLVS
jgi:hypothetical protein